MVHTIMQDEDLREPENVADKVDCFMMMLSKQLTEPHVEEMKSCCRRNRRPLQSNAVSLSS